MSEGHDGSAERDQLDVIVSDRDPTDPNARLTLEDYARLANYDYDTFGESFECEMESVSTSQMVALFDRLRDAEGRAVRSAARRRTTRRTEFDHR